MGEIFRFGNIIVRIWSNDHNPSHVEVFWPSMKSPEGKAKFKIEDLSCYECVGFSAKDIKEIRKELLKRHSKIKEKWREIHEQD